MANNREYYPDLDSIGKHYLVSTTLNPHIKRHYTTCCGMNPVIYDKLVESLNERSKEHTQSLSGSTSLDQNPEDAPAYIFDTKLLNSELSDKVRLCVKNYGQLKGVSTALHAFKEYEVKGPMGKGLCVKQTGVHVAFAAGTGVLVFVDLVMQLALVNMQLAHLVINDPTQVLDL